MLTRSQAKMKLAELRAYLTGANLTGAFPVPEEYLKALDQTISGNYPQRVELAPLAKRSDLDATADA